MDQIILYFSLYQTLFWWKAKWVKNADIKIICGSNLLAKSLLAPTNDLNIHYWNSSPLKNSVLMGIGNSRLDKKINLYTKKLYKKILSKDHIHSARDEETTQMLRDLGFKAITTGCPTLWSLDTELCSKIPIRKSNNVIFTLTGVQRDPVNDQKMLDILKKNYKKRYFYVQTIWDLDYLHTLKNIKDVIIIDSSIQSYKEALENFNVDYVGTRLHGGIFAMQNKVRSIIITIDNRTRNINKINNLNVVEREKINELEKIINNEIKTDIKIDYDSINKWLDQFKKEN